MKPYTRTIDGEAIQVSRLTPSQIIALLEEAHEARRAALVEDLEAAGASVTGEPVDDASKSSSGFERAPRASWL